MPRRCPRAVSSTRGPTSPMGRRERACHGSLAGCAQQGKTQRASPGGFQSKALCRRCALGPIEKESYPKLVWNASPTRVRSAIWTRLGIEAAARLVEWPKSLSLQVFVRHQVRSRWIGFVRRFPGFLGPIAGLVRRFPGFVRRRVLHRMHHAPANDASDATSRSLMVHPMQRWRRACCSRCNNPSRNVASDAPTRALNCPMGTQGRTSWPSGCRHHKRS